MTLPSNPTPPPRRASDLPQNPLDLRTVCQTLRERFWIVGMCFVTGVALASAYLHRAPRIYSAAATLQVEQLEQRVVKFDKVQQEDLRFTDMLQTIVQTVACRPVLQRVVQEQNLVRVFTPPSGIEPTVEEAAAMLGKAVDVRLRRGTRLIDVTISTTDPHLSRTLANALVKQFIRFTFEQESASSQAASEFLLEEAERLKKKLEDSERKLQSYKEEVKSISLEDRHDIITSRLKELSQRVNEAKTTCTRLEIEYLQVQNLASNITALLVLPSVAADPTISSVVMSLSNLQNDFSNLQQRYKEKHPKFIQASGQVNDWGCTLTNAVLRKAKTIQATYENAKNTERALERALREQEQLALELSKRGVQYNVLQREIASDRALYDSVLTRLKETTLTKELRSEKVRILELAPLPPGPVLPKTRQVMVFGLLGGLLSGILLVFGLHSLDTSVKAADQVEEILGAPALTAIQHLRELRDPRKQLVVQEQAQSAGAEAFRSLRTSISMLGRQEARRSILFTSAIPGEGKTFCAVNFALCLAQSGLRTVLIDADLRRPAVERTLTGKKTDHPGVTDFLTGHKPIRDVIAPSQHERLFYIPAGTTAPNPSELLSQGGFGALIEKTLRTCDRVVVDSAPIHPVSDTLLLTPHVQTVLLVVRAGRTPSNTSIRGIEALRNAGAPVSGVVLNGVKVSKMGGDQYDRYYGDRG